MRSGSNPSISYDPATGKAKAVRNVGASANELIELYNTLLDALALFQEPDVIDHLLKGDNLGDKPSAIQNAGAGILALLDARLNAASLDATTSKEEALAALRLKLEENFEEVRTQLTNEHTAATTQLTEQFDERLATQSTEHRNALERLTAQHTATLAEAGAHTADAHNLAGSYARLDAYTSDIYSTIKSLAATHGLHPVRQARRLMGATVQKEFTVAGLHVTITTNAPDTYGKLHDHIVIHTASKSQSPRIVPVNLATRTSGDRPGLTPEGRTKLIMAIGASTEVVWKHMAETYTDDELARIYQNPDAARKFFEGASKLKEFQELTAAFSLFGPGVQFMTVGCGREDCKSCSDRNKPSAQEHLIRSMFRGGPKTNDRVAESHSEPEPRFGGEYNPTQFCNDPYGERDVTQLDDSPTTLHSDYVGTDTAAANDPDATTKE